MMRMIRNKTLGKWAIDNPDLNPFDDCLNINEFGGSDLYWEEFLYRYSKREIFDPDGFINAIKRVFIFNKYKYERLLNTTLQSYNLFDNYRVQKAGTETTTYNINNAHTGNDVREPRVQKTRTDNLQETSVETPGVIETKIETPTVKTRETVTPTVKTRETVTPTVKTRETEEKGNITTTRIIPEGYVDETSRTTYDDSTYEGVQKVVHSPIGDGGTTVVTPSGTGDTKTTEVLSGDTQTLTEIVSGNTQREFENISGNTTTRNSYEGENERTRTNTGTSTTTEAGNETIRYNSSKNKTGSEELGFNLRVDSGYMYREPQNAIRDERDIAYFAILNNILEDVERATLISVY